jgi:hypothetical protein
VLQPYTAYVRSDGDRIWLTDDVPLLGVRDGAPEPLDAPITDCPPPNTISLSEFVITGMNTDWTTLASDTCEGWTSESPNDDIRLGRACSVETYLYEPAVVSDCDGPFFAVYCVEQ